MFIISGILGLMCFLGVVNEFFLPEDSQSQSRLFFNAIFMGLNLYFAWAQL